MEFTAALSHIKAQIAKATGEAVKMTAEQFVAYAGEQIKVAPLEGSPGVAAVELEYSQDFAVCPQEGHAHDRADPAVGHASADIDTAVSRYVGRQQGLPRLHDAFHERAAEQQRSRFQGRGELARANHEPL